MSWWKLNASYASAICEFGIVNGKFQASILFCSVVLIRVYKNSIKKIQIYVIGFTLPYFKSSPVPPLQSLIPFGPDLRVAFLVDGTGG